MTQSISKINACQHPPASSKSGAKGLSSGCSKRNELANYLSKILNQQQKLQMNTYDSSQLQALYNPTMHATQQSLCS